MHIYLKNEVSYTIFIQIIIISKKLDYNEIVFVLLQSYAQAIVGNAFLSYQWFWYLQNLKWRSVGARYGTNNIQCLKFSSINAEKTLTIPNTCKLSFTLYIILLRNKKQCYL